jgi:hypothetical protein
MDLGMEIRTLQISFSQTMAASLVSQSNTGLERWGSCHLMRSIVMVLLMLGSRIKHLLSHEFKSTFNCLVVIRKLLTYSENQLEQAL